MIRIYNLLNLKVYGFSIYLFFVLCEYVIRACTCTLLNSTSEAVEKSDEFALYT